MDRVSMTTYLVTWYREEIEEAGLTLADEAAGIGPALDAVDTIITLQPSLSPLWFQPLAEYFLLTRIENVFLTSFDVNQEGSSYRLNQLWTNLQKKLDRLRAQVGWIVDPIPPAVGGDEIGKVVTVYAPYLTPLLGGGGVDEW